MAKKQQLNITCRTDVVLHDRLIFDGETFDPSLSVGIVANLVTSMGKRNPLDVEVDGDELVISIPWVEGRNPGCYGLEVTGTCNSKKWSTYADSLIRYTKATRHGAGEVTVESDYYDITMEVGYRYGEGGNVNDVLVNGESVVQAGKARITVPTKVSDLENDADYATQEDVKESKISEVEATIDDNVGTPEVDVTLTGHKLTLAFQNLLGDGIASIEQTTTSEESEGINEVTVTTVGGKVATFQVRNGAKGDTVILGEGVEYTLYNGTGQNTDGAMTQKAVTDAIQEKFNKSNSIEIDGCDFKKLIGTTSGFSSVVSGCYPIAAFQNKIRGKYITAVQVKVRNSGTLTIVKATGVTSVVQDFTPTVIENFTVVGGSGIQLLTFSTPFVLADNEWLGVVTNPVSNVIDYYNASYSGNYMQFHYLSNGAWNKSTTELLLTVYALENNTNVALFKTGELVKEVGLTDSPVAGDKNVLLSEGAAYADDVVIHANYLKAWINGNGLIVASSGQVTTSFIPVKKGQKVRVYMKINPYSYINANAATYVFAFSENIPNTGSTVTVLGIDNACFKKQSVYLDYTTESDGYLLGYNERSVTKFINLEAFADEDEQDITIGLDDFVRINVSAKRTYYIYNHSTKGADVSISGIDANWNVAVVVLNTINGSALYDSGWKNDFQKTLTTVGKFIRLVFRKANESDYTHTELETMLESASVEISFPEKFTKKEEFTSTINDIGVHVLDSLVYPTMEMGNITISNSGWTYQSNTKRVRTPQGYSVHLRTGDRIYLSNYTDAHVYLGWKKDSDGTYGMRGWINSGIFVVEDTGNYCILLANKTEVTTTVNALASLLVIERISDITKLSRFFNYEPIFEESFYPLSILKGANVNTTSIVSSQSYNTYYCKVKKDDKVQFLLRKTQYESSKSWYIGFSATVPAIGNSISDYSSFKKVVVGGQVSKVLTAPSDGYMCVAYYLPDATLISLTAYNRNHDVTNEDIEDFITLDDIEQNKDLHTIYPVASSLTRYSHLFIDKIYNDSEVVVPCQSLFDVRIAAKLGFNLMEINNMKTSDNVWICRHQVDGKFEGLVNNSTGQVEAVTISGMTYDNLKANYKYKSTVPQFRVPVATLEETLAEMRRYNIQPFIYLYDSALTALVKKYFGNRFVAYTSGTTRPSSLKGITAYVYSSAATVADVKSAIDGWGAPYMHGIASPSSFTDAELLELLDYAHSKGCSIGWAGCYMQEATNQHLYELGLDFNASGWDVPEFEHGNVTDIQGNSSNGFAGFTLSGGATIDSDGSIVLAQGESISLTGQSKLLGKCLLDVTFKGSIEVTMGSHITNSQYSEESPREKVFTSVMENELLSFNITAAAESTIYSIDFKASQII